MNRADEIAKANGVILDPNAVGTINNTELAAALVTLGFRVLDMQRLRGDGIRHPEGVVTWRFAPVSDDGRYMLGYVLKRWNDLAWLNDPNNTDPLAFIIAAFQNRRRLLDEIKKGEALVTIKRGRRWALVPENCSEVIGAMVVDHFSGRLNHR